jgi:cytidyltransferase-like protein
MSSSNGGPSNGAGNELAARRAQLELQAQRLRQQAAAINGELAECEAAIRTCKQAESDGAAEPEPKRACRPSADAHMPKKWRHVSEVQAEFAEKRAAGKLLPFGAPGRVPRVYIDGCFDMMHSGHMNAVRQAKLLAEEVGGTLVVGVHTAVDIEAAKGPPVMRDDERLGLTAAVRWVDELVFATPYSATLPFLDSIDIDFCVHGDDMSIGADGKDAYGEAKEAGRIKIVKRTEGVSTTDLVGRLLLLTREHHAPGLSQPLRLVDS